MTLSIFHSQDKLNEPLDIANRTAHKTQSTL